MLRLGHALHLVPALLDGDERHARNLADAPLELAVTPVPAHARLDVTHGVERAGRVRLSVRLRGLT